MRNVTELPARMDARWELCLFASFLLVLARLPPALLLRPLAAVAGLIDEDWVRAHPVLAAHHPGISFNQ